jgi:hypothetical protein
VQPLHLSRKRRAACHRADGRHALSAFIASHPIRWQAVSRSSSRRRACWVCWRTVRPYRAARYTCLLFCKKLPLYAKDTCLCACPPSAIKGEACDVTHTRNLRSHHSLASSYKLTGNTSHSGVGYYAPAARTTLNPCVFLCSSHSYQRSSKTPKPLLISGFRAGALRHPAGDLLSDNARGQSEASLETGILDLQFCRANRTSADRS